MDCASTRIVESPRPQSSPSYVRLADDYTSTDDVTLCRGDKCAVLSNHDNKWLLLSRLSDGRRTYVPSRCIEHFDSAPPLTRASTVILPTHEPLKAPWAGIVRSLSLRGSRERSPQVLSDEWPEPPPLAFNGVSMATKHCDVISTPSPEAVFSPPLMAPPPVPGSRDVKDPGLGETIRQIDSLNLSVSSFILQAPLVTAYCYEVEQDVRLSVRLQTVQDGPNSLVYGLVIGIPADCLTVANKANVWM